ncbi:MAG: RNA polymerase sigma factor [Endomicrobiales bacterium]
MRKEEDLDKEELLRIADTVRGNTVSFGYIVDKYKDRMFDLCLRMAGNRQEAEDLTQETFLKAFKNLKQYGVQYKFSTWLYTLALNTVRNHLRRKKILSFFPLGKTVENEDGEETTFEPPERSGALPGKPASELAEQWTEKLVMSLSPALRPAFVLRYVHDLKYEEISSILGVPVNTVKVHLNRARTYLYDRFRQEYNETFLP